MTKRIIGTLTEHEEFQLLKKEVDTLQATVLGSRTPWYRSISIITSIFALLLSFSTATYSIMNSRSQDIKNAKTELQSVLQRISQTQIDIIKLHQNGPQLSETDSNLNKSYAQQNSVLIEQAVNIYKNRLGAENTDASEFAAIAYALQLNYDHEKAKEFAELAVRYSVGLNVKTASLRILANLHFLTNEVGKGRTYFQDAHDVISKYKDVNDYTRRLTQITTELYWAGSEAYSGDMPQATAHLAKAESYVAGLPPGPEKLYLQQNVAQTRARIMGVSPAAAAQ